MIKAKDVLSMQPRQYMHYVRLKKEIEVELLRGIAPGFSWGKSVDFAVTGYSDEITDRLLLELEEAGWCVKLESRIKGGVYIPGSHWSEESYYRPPYWTKHLVISLPENENLQ